jgi:hypothetical protein
MIESSARDVPLEYKVVAGLIRRLFFCALGYHHRSGSHAKVTINGVTSRCKFCGKSMIKHFNKGWIIDELLHNSFD